MPLRDEDSVGVRLDRLERTLRELIVALDPLLENAQQSIHGATHAAPLQRTQKLLGTLRERLERE